MSSKSPSRTYIYIYLCTKVYSKPRKICAVDDADYRCEHSLRQAKRSIPSPSRNSLSIKRYGVFMIRNTKLRCYDERHNISISQPTFSFVFFLSEFLARDSQRSSCPGIFLRAHCFFFFNFFCRTFLAKTSAGVFQKQQ